MQGVARLTVRVLGMEAPLTRFFIGLCGVVYLFTAVEEGQVPWIGLSVRVAHDWGALIAGGPAWEPWRYVTANFLHFGLLHVGVNGMMLWSFGRALEERLGSGRMAVLFVGCGTLGFVASDVVYRLENGQALTGGASAGVAALIGGFIGFAYGQHNPVWKRVLTAVVLYGVLFAVVLPMQGINVNHSAHLGGFLPGGLVGLHLARSARRGGATRALPMLGMVLTAIAVVAVVGVRLTAA